MSLKPETIGPVPEETARVAHASFPKGSSYTRMRDELGIVWEDEDFAGLFPARGRPALAPWRLALVTVMQFAEGLSDRQAADAVRSRIDWKYALGLELTDPGFDFSVLSGFRARLLEGGAERLLLDKLLAECKDRGLVKAGGKQRTDSTRVLAAVKAMGRLECIGETLRAALNAVRSRLLGGCGDWRRRAGTSATGHASRNTGCPKATPREKSWRSRSVPTASGYCGRSMPTTPRRDCGGWKPSAR